MFFLINNKKYCLDLDVLFNYINDIPSSEKQINTTISQLYDDEMDGEHKEIVESKNSFNEAASNIRYDFIKTMMISLVEKDVVNFGELTFMQSIFLNTLIEYKILVELNTNED